MDVKCRVCEKEKPKRKVIKKMPSVENELPEEFSDYREYMCMNIIKELRKDNKWYDAVCHNRMLILKKKVKNK